MIVPIISVCVRQEHLPEATGLILTNRSLIVPADTPPPAYMPPDEQLGQESQSMETSSSLVPPNIARGGEQCIGMGVLIPGIQWWNYDQDVQFEGFRK